MGKKGGAALAAAGCMLLLALSPVVHVSGQDAVPTRAIRLPLVVGNSSIRVTTAPRVTTTPVPTAAPTQAPTATPSGPRQAILRAGVRAKIMPIGDSLTRGGEDLGEPHYSYRGPLQKKLRDTGYSYDFVGSISLTSTLGNDFQHDGHAGYTIGGVDPGLDSSGFKMGITDNITRYLDAVPAPDVILLLVGINDVFTSRVQGPWAPDRLETLVEIIKTQRPNAKIVVASLVQLRVQTDDTGLIDSINNRARFLGEKSATDSVFFVDLAAVALQPADFVDDVHLTQTGASKIADAWYNALTR
jgi:lysophospholipase L1-like esterase